MGLQPISDFIIFNENSSASIIAQLSQRLMGHLPFTVIYLDPFDGQPDRMEHFACVILRHRQCKKPAVPEL